MDAPCPELLPLLERFADGECDADDSLRVREHISGCTRCRLGLRSFADLNRRIAQSSPPPAPPDLEARIREALDRADRPASSRRWAPAAVAAAAVLLAATAFLMRPQPASAKTIPAFVVGGAYFHGRYLAGAVSFNTDDANEMRDYFRRVLGEDIVLAAFDAGACEDGGCMGGCPCSLDEEAVPWILYRRGGTAVSLILAKDPGVTLPAYARRSRDGREYHVFDVWGATALVRSSGSRLCAWIARIPEDDLLRSVLDTPEGSEAFSGTPISAHAVVCRACCELARSKKPGAKIKLASMEMIVAGKKGLDMGRFIREVQESGLEIRMK